MRVSSSEEGSLATVAREWTRIGVTGFGGPPAPIPLLRKLVVDREGWMDHHEFEDANAACSLLPGPSSTQLAIFCAYRVAGWPASSAYDISCTSSWLRTVMPCCANITALNLMLKPSLRMPADSMIGRKAA